MKTIKSFFFLGFMYGLVCLVGKASFGIFPMTFNWKMGRFVSLFKFSIHIASVVDIDFTLFL